MRDSVYIFGSPYPRLLDFEAELAVALSEKVHVTLVVPNGYGNDIQYVIAGREGLKGLTLYHGDYSTSAELAGEVDFRLRVGERRPVCAIASSTDSPMADELLFGRVPVLSLYHGIDAHTTAFDGLKRERAAAREMFALRNSDMVAVLAEGAFDAVKNLSPNCVRMPRMFSMGTDRGREEKALIIVDAASPVTLGRVTDELECPAETVRLPFVSKRLLSEFTVIVNVAKDPYALEYAAFEDDVFVISLDKGPGAVVSTEGPGWEGTLASLIEDNIKGGGQEDLKEVVKDLSLSTLKDSAAYYELVSATVSASIGRSHRIRNT